MKKILLVLAVISFTAGAMQSCKEMDKDSDKVTFNDDKNYLEAVSYDDHHYIIVLDNGGCGADNVVGITHSPDCPCVIRKVNVINRNDW